MSNKKKRKAKAIQEKTGMSYAAAINQLNKEKQTVKAPESSLKKVGNITRKPVRYWDAEASASIDAELLKSLGPWPDSYHKHPAIGPLTEFWHPEDDPEYRLALTDQREQHSVLPLLVGQPSTNVRHVRNSGKWRLCWIPIDSLTEDLYPIFLEQAPWWYTDDPNDNYDLNDYHRGRNPCQLKKLISYLFFQGLEHDYHDPEVGVGPFKRTVYQQPEVGKWERAYPFENVPTFYLDKMTLLFGSRELDANGNTITLLRSVKKSDFHLFASRVQEPPAWLTEAICKENPNWENSFIKPSELEQAKVT